MRRRKNARASAAVRWHCPQKVNTSSGGMVESFFISSRSSSPSESPARCFGAASWQRTHLTPGCILSSVSLPFATALVAWQLKQLFTLAAPIRFPAACNRFVG